MAPSLELIQPQGELCERIRQELNEDPKTRDQDLAHIKDWLRKQPHLPDEWEDACILSFLRGCNFSLEKTKQKLDLYFTMRTACPEFFTNRDINGPNMKEVLNSGYGPTLPGLTPEGRRVSIVQGLTKTPLSYERQIDSCKLGLMVADIRLMEETVGVDGDVVVLDAAMLTYSHITSQSTAVSKKYLTCIQEAYPSRVKEIHVINTSPLVDIAYNTLKIFLKEKIRQRVFFHRDASTLHKYIPTEMLPPEMGGTGTSLAELQEAWIQKLEDYTEWFKKQESIKAKEELRPGKPTDVNKLFGIDGSFRQLSID